MSKPTLGLAMITNDAEATIKLLEQYGQYFDKWFITVAAKSKKQYRELIDWAYQNKLAEPSPQRMTSTDTNDWGKLQLSYFKWQDHFGKAREYNRQQITTDYFMWIDSDDLIANPENIRKVFDDMVANDLDAIYMRYDYMQNDQGEAVGDHWRERIVRTNHFKWAQTRVHETLIAPTANTARTTDVVILHNKDKAGQDASMARNIKLLLLDFEETKDPRIAMYLGDNLMYLQQYDEALKYLGYLIANGGWDEDKYRAYLRIAEIQYQQGNYDKALLAADAAANLQPEFPDAYFFKATIYNALKQPHKVYEWVKVGMQKPVPKTLSVVDPTLYEYRGIFMGALAALELGKIEEAHQLLQIVLKRSPNYELAKKMQPLFDEAFYDHKAIKQIQWLTYYLRENGGNTEQFLLSLPNKILCDPRLNSVRGSVIPPQKWPKGSIVYYCGPAAETWGPDTLSKGMGGSEEAVVYLSRELAKLGHDVVVFNDREQAYQDSPSVPEGVVGWHRDVIYQPWTLLNPNDEFDTFIAWRAPENVRGVKARVKLVDLHDTVEPQRVYNIANEEPSVRFFVKSQYHRNLYPELPDDRFVVIGNGIVKEHFE